ncbi:MAG: ABC transporter ATP-binding protein [Lachnospiraceae bacterium]|nr:ABC transporter ATP-binding protein [Lachnospiraceae bacterium]
MSEQVIEVKNLVTEFKTPDGWLPAVNGISSSVEKGKVLGIVGESGCGKSVTSLTVMGLLDEKRTRSSGEILFHGEDLLKLSDRQMQKIRGNRISMIFQEPMTALNPVFTIGFQLEEVVRLHQGVRDRKEARDRVVAMLKHVGIPNPEKAADNFPHQLSGGMRQRVMIAMALLCGPELLIADEPTTALDVTIQAQVLEMMKNLKREFGTGVLFITHDLGVIAEMADDVLVMYAGRVVEQAPVADIFAASLHPYTRGLMASRAENVKKGEKLSCIPGMVPSLKNMPREYCPFADRCSMAATCCREKIPELVEVRPGHFVSCMLVERGGTDRNE